MRIKVTILRDYAETDLQVYRDLMDVMFSEGHEVEFRMMVGNWDQELLVRDILPKIDTPCDLHLVGFIYQPLASYRRSWLKAAGHMVSYIHRDYHELDVDHANIQPVISRAHPDLTIQSPFVVRPFFDEQLSHCLPAPGEKDIDILWCGSEGYPMINNFSCTRQGWLDEFQRLLPPEVRFSRNLKSYAMHEYADMIRRSRITLHLHGLAEHCFRLWEVMHCRGCVVGQTFIQERTWKPVEDVVPSFLTPQEGVDACLAVLEGGGWEGLGRRQWEWYKTHYGATARREWARETWGKIKPS